MVKLPRPTKVSVSFTSISLLSGCWCGADYEEAPSEQSTFVEGVSQVRTPKAFPFIQKAHPCEICDPLLKDIWHLAEQQGSCPAQKLYTWDPCGRGFLCSDSLYHHQQQYTRKDPVQGDDHGASFGKHCAVHTLGRPWTWREAGLDRTGPVLCGHPGRTRCK